MASTRPSEWEHSDDTGTVLAHDLAAALEDLAAELARPDESNANRVGRAVRALEAAYSDEVDDDPADALTDLLADLRHWADAHAVSFADSVRLSGIHHAAEVTDGFEHQARRP